MSSGTIWKAASTAEPSGAVEDTHTGRSEEGCWSGQLSSSGCPRVDEAIGETLLFGGSEPFKSIWNMAVCLSF